MRVGGVVFVLYGKVISLGDGGKGVFGMAGFVFVSWHGIFWLGIEPGIIADIGCYDMVLGFRQGWRLCWGLMLGLYFAVYDYISEYHGIFVTHSQEPACNNGIKRTLCVTRVRLVARDVDLFETTSTSYVKIRPNLMPRRDPGSWRYQRLRMLDSGTRLSARQCRRT